MALKSGDRIGPYEITRLLGSGGMGEVYRAADSSLKRDVAIKVLPETLSTDADRLARFQREAEVLASLNHPNIAQIYGIERAGGASALVMELVEGPTLADRIAQGPVPIDEALPLALQIAEALEAAHEQGIVHRDLKPANIKLRPDGTVKVLDFGLAKAVQNPASSGRGDLANSPTITSPAMTNAGVILGTAAYMAPEQAKGRAVDRRSDVWAFGVVLYEMLTGRRAFDGEDVSDLLVAVLSKDVDLEALPSGMPPDLTRLLRRCLVRDPRQRLRDIGEARIAIAGILSGAGDSVAPPAPALASRRGWLWPACATAALAALVVSLAWSPGRSAPFAPVRILEVPGTLGVRTLAASPDGSTVAFASADGLYLRRLDAMAATRVVERNDVQSLTFSPDGESIAYYSSNDIRLVRRDGSGGRTLFQSG